jgi:2-polyprenyl-3-methyl-5-hydroxy-6-metoxy-1,4-benzoquinol methylase/GNAT superfamily N-acetyltransferase
MKQRIENYKYEFNPGKWVLESQDKVEELAKFYSAHYGIWSKLAPFSSGKKIALSAKRIREWLDNDLSEFYDVRDEGNLIGYAIALKGKSGSKEKIIWVTQFVIHLDYRNTGIGKRLLFSIWGLSSYFSWGLLTANPYAIRALEKATRRRCEPLRIKKNNHQLLNFGKKYVNYIDDETIQIVSSDESKINTKFFVDHSELDNMMKNVSSMDSPWKLGEIDEGWEWFAFTFYDQSQIDLSPEEIEEMLNASDTIAHEAYNRMLMDSDSHKWAHHTKKEINYVEVECNMEKSNRVLDVGCGMGRHSLELSKRGYNVIGVDYAETLIKTATKKADKEGLNTKFILGDFTSHELPFLDTNFECILCVYDVIGSYVDKSKNFQILLNISSLLVQGGFTIISVMNLHLTEYIAKNKFILKHSSRELLSLRASDTMETTGNIFNPDYYLIDKETKVVYRKETFTFNNSYPKELIVRDRRYYEDEITQMCDNADLEIVNKRFVSAGWQNDYDKNDKRAKEILLICRKK